MGRRGEPMHARRRGEHGGDLFGPLVAALCREAARPRGHHAAVPGGAVGERRVVRASLVRWARDSAAEGRLAHAAEAHDHQAKALEGMWLRGEQPQVVAEHLGRSAVCQGRRGEHVAAEVEESRW